MDYKKHEKMEENIKMDKSDIEKYPDHLKTDPQTEGGAESIPKNVKQDPQPYNDYPDNLKTKPEN